MKNQKGTTLLELLIYVAILSLIFVVIGTTLTAIISAQKRIEAKRIVDQNLAFALEKIGQSIKEASAVTGTYPSNELNLTIDGQTVIFSVSSEILRKTTGGNTYDLTSDKVTISSNNSYLFYKIENPSANLAIQIKIRATYKSNNLLQNVQAQAQTAITLRK